MTRVLSIAWVAALAACAQDPADPAVERRLEAASSSSLFGEPCGSTEAVPVFDFATGGAEGVALGSRGDVFVGNMNTGEIWRAPGGDFDRAALLVDLIGSENPLSFLLGLDVAPGGALYAAVNDLGDPTVHGLWRVDSAGRATMVAPFPTNFESVLNDLAIGPGGDVYVSDSFRGAIWRVTPDGEAKVWVQSHLLGGPIHPVLGLEFGVNGLAHYRRALYGVITLTGRVVRVPIAADGTAGTPTVVLEADALRGADGIELDARGNIYFTNNFSNSVQRIRAADLAIEPVVVGGLSAPASMTISRNHTTVYVANLSTSALEPQPDAPALVKADFDRPILTDAAVCSSR